MTAAKPTRWLALARLSDKWRDDPLERQTADLLDVVERNGGVLIEPVLVERVSGSQYRPKSHRRDGWDRIMEAVQAGEIDGVAIYNLDRLTREPARAEDLITAAANGLKVADPATTVDLASGDARHFFRGKIAAAAAESDAISRRVRRANEAKRDAGKPFWSFRPFGFQRDGQHHATEAPIVREVYERFVDGDTLGGIAEWLNSEGITQPERTDKASGEQVAKAWTGNAVRLLLKADRNCGVQASSGGDGRPVYDTRKADGIVAIVDHDTFQAARRLLATNAARYVTPAGNVRRHLLSGLLTCDVCGRRLTSMPITTGAATYVCRKDKRAGRMGCGLKVAAARVEQIVTDAVLAWLEDEGNRERIPLPSDEGKDTVALLAAIQNAKDRIADLLARTRGADAVLTLDDVDAELREAKAEQQAAQAALDRVDAKSPLANLPWSDDPELVREGWEAMTLAQQQATIADVLEPIRIRKSTTRGCVFDVSRVVVVPRYGDEEAAA